MIKQTTQLLVLGTAALILASAISGCTATPETDAIAHANRLALAITKADRYGNPRPPRHRHCVDSYTRWIGARHRGGPKLPR